MMGCLQGENTTEGGKCVCICVWVGAGMVENKRHGHVDGRIEVGRNETPRAGKAN